MPDRLMGLTEIAELLGLSRQGVHQLTKRRSDFPEPFTRLAMGYVWDADQVERWARETGRIK